MLHAATMAIILLVCAELVMRAATLMDVKVNVDEIKGEEYERYYMAARESLGRDENWAYAKLVDYSLVDTKTEGAITLDRPAEVDITQKQPGITPRVAECTGTDGLRFEEIPASKGEDCTWYFSTGDSARLLIIGRSSGPSTWEPKDTSVTAFLTVYSR